MYCLLFQFFGSLFQRDRGFQALSKRAFPEFERKDRTNKNAVAFRHVPREYPGTTVSTILASWPREPAKRILISRVTARLLFIIIYTNGALRGARDLSGCSDSRGFR